jgi:phosphate:Na+ symporter
MIDALFLQVVGAVFLLLYGVRMTGKGFELAFAGTLRGILSSAARGKGAAFAGGFAGTALLQSSGAVVTLLITFTDLAPLPLGRSLAVILGADLGSTLTVQLLSFRLYEFAYPVLSLGIFLNLWGRTGKVRAVGQGVLGFGFLLLALQLLSDAAAQAGRIESMRFVLADLAGAPIVAFAWGLGLAALFQSGTAVLILLIAFSGQHLLPPPAVLPMVLGANVGATTVAFLAAAGLAAPGRRIAWGHVLPKTVAALLFLPFLGYVLAPLGEVTADPSRLAANGHTLFNLTLALFTLPFTDRIASAIEKLVTEKGDGGMRGRALYLDRGHLPVPGVALGQTAREIVRLADSIQGMVDLLVKAVGAGMSDVADSLEQRNGEVSRIVHEIKSFLSAIGEESLDSEQTRRAVAYISIVSDLEIVGDLVDRASKDHLRHMAEGGGRFSHEGSQELARFLGEVSSTYREAVSAFVTRDSRAAMIVVERKQSISRVEHELRLAHIARLRKGGAETLESSSAHLDILTTGKAIVSRSASIARNVLEVDEAAG